MKRFLDWLFNRGTEHELWITVKEIDGYWTRKGTVTSCLNYYIQKNGVKHRVVGAGVDYEDHPRYKVAQIKAQEMEAKARLEHKQAYFQLSVAEKKLVDRDGADPVWLLKNRIL